jgi:hypothetical protein
MTLKLLICIAGIACIWALIILAPIVREKLTRDWRKCGVCGLFWHIRTKEMTFELLVSPKEIEYERCPECRLKAIEREKGRP